jgi:hypothetical protein
MRCGPHPPYVMVQFKESINVVVVSSGHSNPEIREAKTQRINWTLKTLGLVQIFVRLWR